MKILVLALSVSFFCQSCSKLKKFGYEGINRDKWQYPDKVIKSLGITPGDRVTDLGAGGGYFTFKLADAVGSAGKVYAVDVDRDMTEYLKNEVSEKGYSNTEVVLGEFGDPLLPDSVSDMIFLCNTYHHIEDRINYFSKLRTDLSREGQVAIIEHRPGGWIGRLFGSHWTEKSTIIEEMKTAGYVLSANHDFLPKQHFVVFSVGDE